MQEIVTEATRVRLIDRLPQVRHEKEETKTETKKEKEKKNPSCEIYDDRSETVEKIASQTIIFLYTSSTLQ